MSALPNAFSNLMKGEEAAAPQGEEALAVAALVEDASYNNRPSGTTDQKVSLETSENNVADLEADTVLLPISPSGVTRFYRLVPQTLAFECRKEGG